MTEQIVKYDPSSAITLAGQAKAALASAADIVIDSTDMYEIASDELKNIKGLQKKVEEQRTTITGPLNQAVKAVNDLFRAPKEFLEQAETSVKRSMIGWTTEQERLAAEARREAERLAAIERERLAAIEREQQARAQAAEEAAQAAQRAAQAAIAAGDKAAADAAQAEARAQTELAEAAQANAQEAAMTAEIITLTPTVQAPAKVVGISGRMTYSAEIVDLMALIKAVAAGTAPIQCVVADEKFLGAQARAFKKTGLLYPGVNAVAERGIAARAA